MKSLLFFLLALVGLSAQAQFKADNVTYKTVYPEDLCQTLKNNPQYILLDVRSQGEYDDSLSSGPGLNIGHLKNSMHIDIRQLPQRWKELNAYKNRPIFIYCSHSQRSRRASRLLADSGFTKIFNVNGGLTDFYEQGIQENPCKTYEIVSNLPYKILSSKQLAGDSKSYYVIDLRSDSVFNGIASREKTSMQGKFTGAVSMPYDKFMASTSFTLPSRPILLVDEDGDQSPQAAIYLTKKGYKDIHILFGGMSDFSQYYYTQSDQSKIKYETVNHYGVLSADNYYSIVQAKKIYTLIDLRTANEFQNKSKNYWQNIGNLQGAINVPYAELANNPRLPANKDGLIILYAFNDDNDIYAASHWLKDNGYHNVHILHGGIWNIRWAAHNLKGKEHLSELVVNVPQESL